MNEWNVFLVIVALVSFIIAVCGPMLKLNTTMTKLIDAVKYLEGSLEKMSSANDRTHERLWKEIDHHDERLHEHETRLRLIEGSDDK